MNTEQAVTQKIKFTSVNSIYNRIKHAVLLQLGIRTENNLNSSFVNVKVQVFRYKKS